MGSRSALHNQDRDTGEIELERLAVIAAITLAIRLVRPEMNVMVNDSKKWVPLIILLLIMLAISLTRLHWSSQTGLVVISRLRGGVRKMIAQATAG